MLQLRNGRRYAAAALLGLILALLASTPATAADCEFRLGFKALRDLIGHDIVGECLEDEHYNAIGDSNQHTTGGLLAWRKADNWTAFTDGYRTWVNGPDGLQQRLNAERFEWEADYAEITGQAAKPALTRDALRNAEYAANFPSFGTLQRDRIGAQDPLAFGDLNGDGTDDAALVLLLVDGNAGHRYLAAVLNESGVPRHVASIFLGLNIGIDSVAVANRVVTLQTRQLGPNDPNCCPSQEVVITFRLTDNAWQLLAETPPGQITANLPARTPTPPPSASLDPALAHAFHMLRTTWQPAGEGIYQVFVSTGASARFGPIEGASQWQSAPNRITINEEFRTESPEALAHALIWPTLALGFHVEAGAPQSWEACMERITAQHTAQANWWLNVWGESGNPIPTQLEQQANNNLAQFLDGQLGDRILSSNHYRQYCANFGKPLSPQPSPQLHRDTVSVALSYELAKELGHKEGTAAFNYILGILRRSIEEALWLYEGHYVMNNPRLGNADPRLAIGNDSKREAFIRQMLNDPDTMRRITREVRAWLYNALSGRTTGSIQDTGNVWLNELLRSDPNGFAFWVGSLEEAFVRILTTASMAENVAPLRRSTLERQIGMFLYANEQNPRRTTGPALLPERWIELLLSQ